MLAAFQIVYLWVWVIPADSTALKVGRLLWPCFCCGVLPWAPLLPYRRFHLVYLILLGFTSPKVFFPLAKFALSCDLSMPLTFGRYHRNLANSQADRSHPLTLIQIPARKKKGIQESLPWLLFTQVQQTHLLQNIFTDG